MNKKIYISLVFILAILIISVLIIFNPFSNNDKNDLKDKKDIIISDQEVENSIVQDNQPLIDNTKDILDEASKRLGFELYDLYSSLSNSLNEAKFDSYRITCKYNDNPDVDGVNSFTRVKLSDNSLKDIFIKLANAVDVDTETVFGIEGCPSRYVYYSIDDGTDEGNIMRFFYLDNKAKVLLLTRDNFGVFGFNTEEELDNFIESLK